MANNNAPHILNTSATLAGFCFFVIASINALKTNEKTIIDNLTAIGMCMFVLSSILSFISMRSVKGSSFFERVADIIFMIGLSLIFIITLLITFNQIQ